MSNKEKPEEKQEEKQAEQTEKPEFEYVVVLMRKKNGKGLCRPPPEGVD